TVGRSRSRPRLPARCPPPGVEAARSPEGTRMERARVHAGRALPAACSPRLVPTLLVGIAACVTYAACYLGRGLDVPDEGLLLHVAERLAGGEVPYRDVYFIYTPGL